MDDVTHLFSTYRECVRHLWNTYFRPVAEPTQNWDLRDEFDTIARGIFSSLVLRPMEFLIMNLLPNMLRNHQYCLAFVSFPLPKTALRYSSIATCREVATGTIRCPESGPTRWNCTCCGSSILTSLGIETSATLR